MATLSARKSLRVMALSTVSRVGPSDKAAAADYRLAVDALSDGKLNLARDRIESALVVDDTRAAWHYRHGFILERLKDYQGAIECYQRAISIEPGVAEWHYRLAQCLSAVGDRSGAAQRYETALHLDSGHERAARALFGSISRNTPIWRQRQILEKVAQALRDPVVTAARAEAAAAMGDHPDVIATLAEVPTEEIDVRGRVLLARAYEQVGDASRARRQFQLACQAKSSRAAVLGPGIFFEEQGDWRGAADRYVAEWESGTVDAELAFRAGYAFDRQYLWADAQRWFMLALALDPSRAYWHYKLAHALERQGKMTEAVSAYSVALDVGGRRQKDWFYRLASCLCALGRHDDALAALFCFAGRPELADRVLSHDEDTPAKPESQLAWLGMRACQLRADIARAALDVLPTQPAPWAALAEALGDLGEIEKACEAYTAYERRVSEIDMPRRVEHARLLASSGRLSDACDVLLGARKFARPDGLPLDRLTNTPHKMRRALYIDYRERLEVDEQLVLLESYWGDKVACNPLAIYRAMTTDDRLRGYHFIWVVKEGVDIPADVLGDGRTSLARYGSELHVRALATAGILVNNTSFVEYVVPRENQRYLNTWHGTPLKTLGRRIGTGILEYANVARNLRATSFIAAPNPHTLDVLVNDYDLSVTYAGKAVALGSPRLDPLVGAGAPERAEALARLGISGENIGQVVFYAPTWRGGASDRTLDVEGIRADLSAMASVPGTLVLYRVHHMVENLIGDIDVDAVRVPQNVDTYDVLPAVDVLVTDYSSLMFDFLVTGRKVVIYAPDLEEYIAERGVYFRPDEVLDDVVYSRDDLVRELADTTEFLPGPKYLAAREQFTGLEDGGAARRCIDLLLDPAGSIAEHSCIDRDDRETVVFFASLIPNGITSALLNLLTILDRDRYRPALMVEPSVLERHPDRLEMLSRVPADVALIARNGAMAVSVEERWIIDRFAAFHYLSEPQWSLFRAGYARELLRLFGNSRSVTLVEFEGYSVFWMSLFSCGVERGHASVALMHSEMLAENKTKHPYLEAVFQLYRRFGALAAVSEATAALNAHELHEAGYVDPCAVQVVHNALDPRAVEARAVEAIELTISERHPLIVTIGRLSTEKNQIDAIRAMHTVIREHPKAQLIIIGSGPLAEPLRAAARDLGLERHVTFTGQLSNPMPVLAAADVYVMSSLHEGQPQVLFEAMILGRPIVTYPTSGIEEAVRMGYGAVVEPTPTALARGILASLAGEIASRGVFDADRLNTQSIDEFDDVLARARTAVRGHQFTLR